MRTHCLRGGATRTGAVGWRAVHGTELSTGDAHDVIEQLLTQWEREGRMIVGPKDFLAHSDEVGRKPTWIKNQIRDMRAASRLAETSETGRYRIVPTLTPA